MRQMISGMIAALAVVTAGVAPASACGLFDCGVGYTAPVYTGCGCGFSAGYERLPDPAYQYGAQSYYPVHQYYYVNQGPTYSGPGEFAPYRSYQEEALPYRYHAYRVHHGYRYWGHSAPNSIRYGYHGMPHHFGYRGYSHRRYY